MLVIVGVDLNHSRNLDVWIITADGLALNGVLSEKLGERLVLQSMGHGVSHRVVTIRDAAAACCSRLTLPDQSCFADRGDVLTDEVLGLVHLPRLLQATKTVQA